MHNNTEGTVSYTNLLCIPSSKPFDLFNPDRKSSLKLYINRVFITDKCDNLIPAYLRFVKGIVDTQDIDCLLYTSPSPRDRTRSRMPSSA